MRISMRMNFMKKLFHRRANYQILWKNDSPKCLKILRCYKIVETTIIICIAQLVITLPRFWQNFHFQIPWLFLTFFKKIPLLFWTGFTYFYIPHFWKSGFSEKKSENRKKHKLYWKTIFKYYFSLLSKTLNFWGKFAYQFWTWV